MVGEIYAERVTPFGGRAQESCINARVNGHCFYNFTHTSIIIFCVQYHIKILWRSEVGIYKGMGLGLRKQCVDHGSVPDPR